MEEINFTERNIKASGVSSLSWNGEDLVDWIAGGRRFCVNGEIEDASINYAYSFDAAIVSPSGSYVVLYTKYQTKGILLKNNKIIREINRSFYQADSYEYPITFAKLKNGKEALIHCPEDYCQLDIEDIETGKILTSHKRREPNDFFHSRLLISPNGKWLMSAGWVWHPLDCVELFDIATALKDPLSLDKPNIITSEDLEISSAAFLDDNYVFVGSSDEFINEPDSDNLGANTIALWSLESNDYIASISCNSPIGELLPIDQRYVVSFYKHPRLWDMNKKIMVHEWSDINSGTKRNSFAPAYNEQPYPPLAIDHIKKRFAVADRENIYVVEF